MDQARAIRMNGVNYLGNQDNTLDRRVTANLLLYSRTPDLYMQMTNPRELGFYRVETPRLTNVQVVPGAQLAGAEFNYVCKYQHSNYSEGGFDVFLSYLGRALGGCFIEKSIWGELRSRELINQVFQSASSLSISRFHGIQISFPARVNVEVLHTARYMILTFLPTLAIALDKNIEELGYHIIADDMFN